MTEPSRTTKEEDVSPTEVLAETIDLSSETASSVESSVGGGGWRPVLPVVNNCDSNNKDPPLVKYTYFGYETYARPTSDQVPQRVDKQLGSDGKNMGERRSKSRTGNNKGGECQVSFFLLMQEITLVELVVLL